MSLQALKGIRVGNGYTQEKAAELLGITRVHYSRKECKKVKFSTDEIETMRIAWKMTDQDVIRCFFT